MRYTPPMRVIVSILAGLALCGCPVITKDLADQKTMLEE
jgi:hypothetical protein